MCETEGTREYFYNTLSFVFFIKIILLINRIISYSYQSRITIKRERERARTSVLQKQAIISKFDTG